MEQRYHGWATVDVHLPSTMSRLQFLEVRWPSRGSNVREEMWGQGTTNPKEEKSHHRLLYVINVCSSCCGQAAGDFCSGAWTGAEQELRFAPASVQCHHLPSLYSRRK